MDSLKCDATSIWTAGVDAVRAKPLVRRSVQVCGDDLRIGDHRWSRDEFDRILVVGAGKAGTAMTEGLLEAIGPWLSIRGWVNVPEGTEASLPGVHIHPARPAGRNEPTEQGEAGAKQMLKMVESATERDLCIALISGGGQRTVASAQRRHHVARQTRGNATAQRSRRGHHGVEHRSKAPQRHQGRRPAARLPRWDHDYPGAI